MLRKELTGQGPCLQQGNLHPTSSLVLWHGVVRLFAFLRLCFATMHASAPAPTGSKLEETESGMLIQYLILCPLRLIQIKVVTRYWVI
jgi:hypothetical protein